ncbi:glycosyltransferase [Roseovarius aquimarinus]|uniref:Glycosyltransferase n=1 Tax=Roseovarius aquimarinus TaxID=1229156 RepID=A0ABW7IAU0_9RHOB
MLPRAGSRSDAHVTGAGAENAAEGRRLVAVVVTCNRLAQLRATLTRLRAAKAEGLGDIIVIDNASSDGTAEWLAGQNGAGVFIERCAENRGGAGGFALGLRLAAERFGADWTLVMDDDARPEPGAIAAFLAAPRGDAMAWAAAVYHPDGRICDMNRPALNPFWDAKVMRRTVRALLSRRSRDGFHLGASDYAGARQVPVDTGSFVGLFVSRAAIDAVGHPDASLFIYGDDVLYSLAIRRAGGRILFDPAIRFEHDFQTMTRADPRFHPLWKTYYHYRNLLIVYRIAAGGWFWLILPLFVTKWAFKAKFHRHERGRYLALLARAVRDGLRRRTQVPHGLVLSWSGAAEAAPFNDSGSCDDTGPEARPRERDRPATLRRRS